MRTCIVWIAWASLRLVHCSVVASTAHPVLQFVHVWQWHDEHCRSKYRRLHVKHVRRCSVLHAKSLLRPAPAPRPITSTSASCARVSDMLVVPDFF